MIKKTQFASEHIAEAICDCCGKNMLSKFHGLGDHMTIGGYQNGKHLEAVVCIPCMEEKFTFVKIHKVDNTIGYC